jgi:hypothetical protein
MKYLFLLIIAMMTLSYSSAQSLQDAIRLSSSGFYSSARSSGVSGAFGAMGADFGSVSYNPAATGAYWGSEFSFGFSNNNIFTKARLDGPESKVYDEVAKKKLKFEQIGYVINTQPVSSDWKSASFAIGMNRTANFNQRMYFEGNSKGSFTDRFLERSHGKELDELDNFEGGLAYDVGAIYGPDNNLFYTSDYQKFSPNNLLAKSQIVDSKGGIHEMVFSYGANYQDVFLFGLNIGIPFVNFTETKTYEEEAIDAGSVLKKLTYNEYLQTSGVGLNFKGGAILKIAKYFRLGGSFHSPTYFSLEDEYNTGMLYQYNEGDGLKTNEKESPEAYFKYKFTTPWRFTGSLGAIYKLGDLSGFVDFDAEYTDYSSGKFDFTAYSSDQGDAQNQDEQNDRIRESLKPAITYRLGTELAYKKFRVRGGMALPETPFDKDENSNVEPTYTFGAGLRGDKIFVDVAFVREGSGYGYSPYLLVDETLIQPFVDVEKYSSKWMLTFGTRF